jgi:Phage minor capsid protein 2
VPADRTLAEGLAIDVVRLYEDLQTRMAADIARRLAQGARLPGWAQRKYAGVAQLRRAGEMMLAALDANLDGTVEQAIAQAYARGGRAAVDELVKLGRLSEQDARILREGVPQLSAIQRMIWVLVSTLRGTHLQVLRWQLDVYRQVIAETLLTGTFVGHETRLRSAQRAWERFLGRGITGFVDRAGRRWELASYVEMATRTGTAQATVEGHLTQLADQRIDLVMVSNAPQECQLCRSWEGKILSRDTAGQRLVQAEHATQDRAISVQVAGSVSEAVTAGLLHPNCRHSLSAYLPGVTTVPTRTADAEGDEARQRLRELERRLRRAKLKASAVIDPAAKKRLNARVRAIQAQIRGHVDETGLIRQRHREQIGQAR